MEQQDKTILITGSTDGVGRRVEMAGGTGLYFDALRQSRANAQAYDAAARERLRLISLKLAGLPLPATTMSPRG